ncbi:QacE family quaternary ammonium compound efflux SMR transporter [Brevibacterium sp. 5221]|uniref:QacE family quaternary ammonium compound efflux SMR transporter n=2 Tax=Brevibacteriaceae TaxID=85019 RepID=A0A6N9H6T0_9MICO|nr:QacE family quaternary ammonium compound efflux SMR transporter [Brevibacterium rongguiense]
MLWFVLILSGLGEPLWALALALRGRQLLLRAGLFLVGAGVSMGGLAWALSAIPVSVGYAVWVGVGAAATFGLSVARGQDRLTLLRAGLVVMLLGGVVGLKAVS